MTSKLTQLIMAMAIAASTVGLSASLAAQSPVAQKNQTATQQMSVTGTLDKVDVDAKTITVKKEDNSTIVFSFTDETKIVGAEQGVAGLATMNGAHVTVRYTVEGRSNVATEVDVLK
jgi:Cu/Ag efflux protein CusF